MFAGSDCESTSNHKSAHAPSEGYMENSKQLTRFLGDQATTTEGATLEACCGVAKKGRNHLELAGSEFFRQIGGPAAGQLAPKPMARLRSW